MLDHAFVVLGYKLSPFLAGCLDTLVAQTTPSRIVISTSTPNELIAQQAERVGAKVLINPKSDGIGADWNFGLRATGARYVTLVHQDDTYRPGFLQKSIELLRRHDGDLCFTGYQEIDDEGRPTSSKISKVKHLIEAATLTPVRQPSAARMRAFLAFGAPLPCSSVTYDVSRLDDFEFSRDYAANLDWDAWLRLIDMGKRFVRHPARLVGRRHNALTATSQLIANGCRRREDLDLFRRIWPRPIGDTIALLYRAGY